MLIIGDSEVEKGEVSVRKRGEDGDLGAMSTADFIARAVEEIDNKVVFKVTGYGHGLGMSQTGSNYYAEQGYTYDEIIKHYYTGVDITKAVED